MLEPKNLAPMPRLRMKHLPLANPLIVAALFATVTTTSCSPSAPSESCPPAYSHATFRLTVKGDGIALPRGVVITVKYGSGKEVYDVDHPNQTPQVVFCKQTQDGGTIGVDAFDEDASALTNAESIVCDLWTDGAATVSVKGQGYPDVEKDLVAERDDCGLKLAEETILIEAGD